MTQTLIEKLEALARYNCGWISPSGGIMPPVVVSYDDIRALIDEAPEVERMTLIEQLEALHSEYEDADCNAYYMANDLRAIIEQAKAEKQEPVGYTTMESINDAFTAGEAVFGQKISGLREVALYTRPAPKTYTESDIDVAIGSVDWANTSWQQAAVEAKKLVMRFAGSQVTMEPKRLSEVEVSSIIDNMAYGFAVPTLWRKAFFKFANTLMDKMTGGGE